MRSLAIETSGSTFSLALSDNGTLCAEVFWHSGLRHSENLIPALKSLLEKAEWRINDIEKIFVSVGPGSFTGIRVGLTCARMLAQSLKIPVCGVNSLDILSAACMTADFQVYPMIDALRGEVFVKTGKNKTAILKIEDACKTLKQEGREIIPVGSGFVSYSGVIKKSLGKKLVEAKGFLHYPRAGVLATAFEKQKAGNYKNIEPLYIRRSWAEERK